MNRFVTSAALAMMVASGAFAQDTATTDAAATDAAPAADMAAAASADGATDNAALTDTAVDHNDGIRNFNAEDVPTFAIAADGTVDWPTFSGFRRYHAECHVCHGPDGEGSSYAPALKNSVMRIDYYDFVGIVAGGKQEVGQAQNQVMPSFGANPNVMCYLDDIYTYLRARGTEAIPRGRPAKKEAKTDAYDAAEASCMGF
nr:c-type cytochrome, methanol metabolism-related [Loktanella sp. M215]